MIRHVELGGSRLTDLAARARMTKPAMANSSRAPSASTSSPLASDPTDRRARTIAFTARGHDLLTAARHGGLAAEGAAAAGSAKGSQTYAGSSWRLPRAMQAPPGMAAMPDPYRPPLFAIVPSRPGLPYSCR